MAELELRIGRAEHALEVGERADAYGLGRADASPADERGRRGLTPLIERTPQGSSSM